MTDNEWIKINIDDIKDLYSILLQYNKNNNSYLFTEENISFNTFFNFCYKYSSKNKLKYSYS